jgi:hypothetical protein
VVVHYDAETYICPLCGLEAGTLQSAGTIQKAIADAYRNHNGLMNVNEIKILWESKGWPYKYFAGLLNTQPSIITRWESGLIQSRRMDQLLKHYMTSISSD